MATLNSRGGWDITDEEAAEVLRLSEHRSADLADKYDAGPGHPLSGCGDGAAAMTAMEHYLAAERCLFQVRHNASRPDAIRALHSEAMLHYVAALAAERIEARQ